MTDNPPSGYDFFEDEMGGYLFDPRLHDPNYVPTEAEREETARFMAGDYFDWPGLGEADTNCSNDDSQPQEPDREEAIEKHTAITSSAAASNTADQSHPFPPGSFFKLPFTFDDDGAPSLSNQISICYMDEDHMRELSSSEESAGISFAEESYKTHGQSLSETQHHRGQSMSEKGGDSDVPVRDVTTIVDSKDFLLKHPAGGYTSLHDAKPPVFDEENLAAPTPSRRFIANSDHVIARVLRNNWTRSFLAAIVGFVGGLAWQWVMHGWRPGFLGRTAEEQERWCQSSRVENLLL